MAKRGNPNAAEVGKLGGRPKGSKDKFSRDLKQRVIDCWERLAAEGKDLFDEAEQDPKWFYQNFVKVMLPKDVNVGGQEDNPIIGKIIIKHVKPGD